MLSSEFQLGVLWDDYGIVGDIIVSILIILFFLANNVALQPFTNKFPRADIHELISPDLLHQLIKGTFKDHIVTWITQYVIAKHTERAANKILDDIDRRSVNITTNISIVTDITIVLHWRLHLQVCEDFRRAETSNNGQGTIQKP